MPANNHICGKIQAFASLRVGNRVTVASTYVNVIRKHAIFANNHFCIFRYRNMDFNHRAASSYLQDSIMVFKPNHSPPANTAIFPKFNSVTRASYAEINIRQSASLTHVDLVIIANNVHFHA